MQSFPQPLKPAKKYKIEYSVKKELSVGLKLYVEVATGTPVSAQSNEI